MDIFLIIVAAVVIGVPLVIYIYKQAEAAKERARIRHAGIISFADQRGFTFEPGHDDSHDERYAHFEVFRRGFDRYAYNTMSGAVDLGKIQAQCRTGDFTYKTRETYTTTDSKGRTTTHTRIVKHDFSYFIVELPFERMPDMLVRREGIFDKIAAAFGKNDIDFESAEFSRKYFVQCDQRKFAYDIINQRMIEFLLKTKPGLIDMENARICLTDGMTKWPHERFDESLEWTRSFVGHWPDFVIKDLEEGRIV